MALGLHLEHPPPRTVSLQRSKEIHLLSNQRRTGTVCSVPDSFLLSLELYPPTSCPPLLRNDWATMSRDMNDPFDYNPRDFPSPQMLDDDIPLPSTPPTPRFFPLGSSGGKSWFGSEEEEEVDIQIPLMTSLFYDDGGCTISFPRDRPSKLLPYRDETMSSPEQTFPRDVDAFSTWGFSPSPTPRPTTPTFSPPRHLLSVESDSALQTITNLPLNSSVQPLAVTQELLRYQSKRRRQLFCPRTGIASPARRLPQPPKLPGQDSGLVNATLALHLGTPVSTQTKEKTIPTVNSLQPSTKPKSRPLPPTPPPKPTPLVKNVAFDSGNSFLNLSSPCAVVDDQMSSELDGLVDIVDDMISHQRVSSFTIGEIGFGDPVLPLRRR